MVALLVSLKLRLLRNSLHRSVWRTVGLVLAAVYALGIVVAVLVGLVALRSTSSAATGDVTVVAYAALSLGWLMLSLLVFGVDETVDPARFALLPVRARELVPGLLAAALVGVPGVATALVALGLVVTWARTPALALAALVAAVLGLLTCVLLSRAATATFASFLSSRRFRDLAAVLLALVSAGLALGANLASQAATRDLSDVRALLGRAAAVASWTPFGWAWSLPADVARGAWATAAVHLVLAVALVVALGLAWTAVLARRLVEPASAGAGGGKVGGGSRLERLLPGSPAGAVALRSLRYWRRDARHVATLASFLVAPLVLLVTLTVNPEASNRLTVFVPAVLAVFLGTSVAQDLSFDGSALWTHVSAGLRGADDRSGRVLAALVVFVPVLVVLHVVSAAVSGAWADLPAALGLTAVLTLAGLGVGSWAGAVWQWPGPVPGESPFQRGNAGGLPALLSALVVTAGTTAAALPVLGLVLLGTLWRPWPGWLALPVGIAVGLVVLRVGTDRGGRLLERRWPEALAAVSERAA